MEINILITSVSRKVWLVEAFKSALKEAKNKGRVISVDANPLSAGFYFSDKGYLVPLSTEENFIPKILEICKKEQIKLIIPTRDAELFLFSKNRSNFKNQGIEIMVSEPQTINICEDKYAFFNFMQNEGISVPKTYLPEEAKSKILRFPLLVKPRTGNGAKDLFKVKNKNELLFFLDYITNPIVQEYIHGTEYSIDLLSDFNKKVIDGIIRERIETLCGESYKGKTVKDDEILSLAKKASEKLGLRGHATLQFIKDKKNAKIIEINPRFGGGAMLGINSGLNTPLIIIKLMLGEEINSHNMRFKEGLIMLRYAKDLYVVKEDLKK